MLIAPKWQPDTAEWNDKQILGLLIEGNGKTAGNKWTKKTKEGDSHQYFDMLHNLHHACTS